MRVRGIGVADMLKKMGDRARSARERRALFDAEAVLFVDDDEPDIFELRRRLDERVRAENDRDLARRRLLPKFSLFHFRRQVVFVEDDRFACRHESDHGLVFRRNIFQKFLERFKMLADQDLGRRHENGLETVLGGRDRRDRGDDRFSGADIALEQAVHRFRLCEILDDLPERLLLRCGERKGESGKDHFDAFDIDRYLRRLFARELYFLAEVRELEQEKVFELESFLRPKRVFDMVGKWIS